MQPIMPANHNYIIIDWTLHIMHSAINVQIINTPGISTAFYKLIMAAFRQRPSADLTTFIEAYPNSSSLLQNKANYAINQNDNTFGNCFQDSISERCGRLSGFVANRLARRIASLKAFTVSVTRSRQALAGDH